MATPRADESLWAHASDDLPKPDNPAPLGADPSSANKYRYARQRADLTAWKSRDAVACITLSSLLPESEEAHFTQVRTASEFLTAIKARYATPTTVSLGRLFLPFLFPDLALFERSAYLIAHLRSLDSSYRASSTDAQLALLPPPMAITIYFITTSLPGRLASVRDVLLLKHPSELTIEVLKSALKDVESNLRSVASASGAVPPPLFHGCTVPQLPTFTASLATAATDVTAAAVTTSSRSRGRSGRRGGQGAGGGGGGGMASGGGRSTEVGGATRAAASDSPAVAGGGDTRVCQAPAGPPAAGAGVAAWYLTQRQQQQRQQQTPGQGSGPRQLTRGACFSQLTDTLHAAYGIDGPAPDWLPLVQTYDPALWGMSASQLLDLLGTPHAMYVVVDSSASYSVYSSVVSLGANVAEVPIASVSSCVDASLGAALEDTSLSFTLDSRASRCFFRDHTTLTPLPAPISVALADPTSGPVTARYTTTLLCPAVPSGFLTGFHVPSFSRNLVGVRLLVSNHAGVWIDPSGETVVCVVRDTYAPLATFTVEPGSVTTADTQGRRVSCLHSDREGEFHSSILAGLCREQGIRQSWTLPESPQQNGVAERRIGLVMEIARTSLTHARAPHFLWPYAVRYAAHQLNLWPHDSSDFTFYHPPLHRFFDSHDVRFDESVPYYVRYPYRGLPVPPPPLFLTSAPPPAPPVQPPPLGPAPSGVSHATPPPSVAPQVQPPSLQSSSQPTADPAGPNVRGKDPGGASSRGVGVGAESVPVRPGFGGAGVEAEPVPAGACSPRGAGVSRAVPGGATTEGVDAPTAGRGESGVCI
ncbi:unnamed protein product [Closterium sp. NIES-54]